jgi:hypothetical protein
MHMPAEGEPREELAIALGAEWQAHVGGRMPWVSGTRALAASTAFYAPDRPRYWSLWNTTGETPWVDVGEVLARGAVIVCETADEACQALAETWSPQRHKLSVAKAARGFQFEAREYVFYLLAPRAAARSSH